MCQTVNGRRCDIVYEDLLLWQLIAWFAHKFIELLKLQ